MAHNQGCQIGRKSASWATWAAVGVLKFSIGTQLLFGLLFDTRATTFGRFVAYFCWKHFRPNVATLH